jgi:hypothetical protein
MHHDRDSEPRDIESVNLQIRIDASHLANIRIRLLGNGVIVVRPPPPPPRLRESTLDWELGENIRLRAEFELIRG